MKVFISDLDGTLLDSTFQSDESVKECIDQVIQTKNDFVIATGRSFYGIQTLNIYNHPIYYVIMNGAVILDRNKNIIYKEIIDTEIVEGICTKYPLDNIEYITLSKTYMTISKEEYLERYSKWGIWYEKMIKHGNSRQLDFMLSHFIFDANISDISDRVIKINILEMDKDKHKEKEDFILNIDGVINNSFDKNVLEITNDNVSKKNAIKKLIEKTGWNKSNIYVFGDGDNDSDMLEYFDNSFAPQNASDKAKKSAKYLIGRNSSKSVIKQIYKILDE